jgi:KAP family P-loop domain
VGARTRIMKLFTDNPLDSIEEDKFGFDAYAKMLGDLILDTQRLPFCIGIFGAWGSGKTSLMKMIRGQIEPEERTNQPRPEERTSWTNWLPYDKKEDAGQYKKVRSIWFSPWKYDKKEDLWNALIQTILYRITEDLSDKKRKEETVRLAKDLALSSTWLVLKKAATVFSSGVVSEQNLDSLVKAFRQQDETLYRHINHFEEDFKKVIDEYTDGGKLVVFVDDLDRCLPENAITVLESLKLFIGDSRCVFVLGMDDYVVAEGIRNSFGERLNLSGRDYLDKIIQVPFFLPPAPFENLKNMVMGELEETEFRNDIQPIEIWKLIRWGMGGNPRKTKRFVNCFYLLQHILKHTDINRALNYRGSRDEQGQELNDVGQLTHEEQNIYLGKLLILQMSFPDFYRQLQSFPQDWKIVEENLGIFSDDDPARREEVLQATPALAGVHNNTNLKVFMTKTSKGDDPRFPPPPSQEIVDSLLQAVSLVTEDVPEEAASRSEQSRAEEIPFGKQQPNRPPESAAPS